MSDLLKETGKGVVAKLSWAILIGVWGIIGMAVKMYITQQDIKAEQDRRKLIISEIVSTQRKIANTQSNTAVILNGLELRVSRSERDIENIENQ